MSPIHKSTQSPENRLLAALPPEDQQRLLPDLLPVTFSLGEVIYESQGLMEYVYFPTSSHVSLLYTMVDGSTAEVGLVGNEGLVGIALFMGGEPRPPRHSAGAGHAVKMKAR